MKAAIGAQALPMFEAEAKERQRTSTGGAQPQLVAKLPPAEKATARDQAAAAVGVSGRYVQDAKRVAKQQPELAAQVQAGAVTLPSPRPRELRDDLVERRV